MKEDPNQPDPELLHEHHMKRVMEARNNALNKEAKAEAEKKRRTPGLWGFDTLLYPILANTGVFAISVLFTYLTEKGGEPIDPKNTAKALKDMDPKELKFGWFGKMLRTRGEKLDEKLMGVGLTEEQAKMTRFVAFSFADGTLFAPLVKLFEDRREKISKKIDTALGTKPKDESVYDEEPKQTWGSVVKGRFATALIVVPTAVALNKSIPFAVLTKQDGSPDLGEKTINFKTRSPLANGLRKFFNWSVLDKPIKTPHQAIDTDLYAGTKVYQANINDLMFNRAGSGFGEQVEQVMAGGEAAIKNSGFWTKIGAKTTQWIEKVSGRTMDKPALFKVMAFEAFYTSVCTLGLYLSSRMFAREKEKDVAREKREDQKFQRTLLTAEAIEDHLAMQKAHPETQQPLFTDPRQPKPSTRLTQPAAQMAATDKLQMNGADNALHA